MSTWAVRVASVAKRYRLGPREPYKALRDAPYQLIAGLGRVWRGRAHAGRDPGDTPNSRSIWALDDVSFEVQRGEALGIIGRNGAGKSTLLKILARITRPTRGQVELRGRIGSLLEVGAGFHHELTGRENIYLDGAILGMKKREIDRKLEQILDFAEIGALVDTPVKHYSTGMYLRLAFAVAAHLEPGILLADEVLAVGDAAFQKKCLGKMGEVARAGRTVLLVSHNLAVVREIAQRGIWLDGGRLLFDGEIKEAIARYLASGLARQASTVSLIEHPHRPRHMRPIFRQVASLRADLTASTEFSVGEPILIEVGYDAPGDTPLAAIGFRIHTAEGVLVGAYNTFMSLAVRKLPRRGKATFTIDAKQLTPGAYSIALVAQSQLKQVEDCVESAIGLTIHPADIHGTGYVLSRDDGVAVLQVAAQVEPLP